MSRPIQVSLEGNATPGTTTLGAVAGIQGGFFALSKAAVTLTGPTSGSFTATLQESYDNGATWTDCLLLPSVAAGETRRLVCPVLTTGAGTGGWAGRLRVAAMMSSDASGTFAVNVTLNGVSDA